MIVQFIQLSICGNNMKKHIILLIALIFLFRRAAADFQIEASAIIGSPTLAFDTSMDTNFSQTYPFLSGSNNDESIFIWGFTPDKSTTPMTYSATRRKFNPQTFDMTDEYIPLNLRTNEEPLIAYSPNGYIGVACTVADANDTNTLNVVVYSFINTIANPDSVSTVNIVSNSTPGANYLVIELFYQDEYFYVIYAQLNTNSPDRIFVQGFLTSNPKITTFTTPLELNKDNNAEIHQIVCAKQPNNSSMICSWRVETQEKVVYVLVDLTNGTVSEETTIVTDSANYRFLPDYIIIADGYFVIILDQMQDGKIKRFSAQVSTTGETVILPFTLKDGYSFANVSAAGRYYDGWFGLIRSTSEEDGQISGTEEVFQLVNQDGSANGTAITVLRDGRVLQGLELSDNSYWILCIDGVTGDWSKGYIMKLFSQTAVFGDLLRPMLAFISLMLSLVILL